MSAFSSQIALTHCGHYAAATGGADSPRALANKQYRALCIASREQQGRRPQTARTNRSNETSAGHGLPPAPPRPGTARKQPSTPRIPTTKPAAAVTAADDSSTPRRRVQGLSLGGPPAAGGARRPQPPVMRSMAQVMMPPPADTTGSSARRDGDRLRCELDQRKARLRREFYGVVFETRRSLEEAAASAATVDAKCAAAAAALAKPQPRRSIPPYTHGGDEGGNFTPMTGDGLGVGGPSALLSPSPRRRLTALERLVQRSSAELQQLRRANAGT